MVEEIDSKYEHSSLLWYCGTSIIAAMKGLIIQAQSFIFSDNLEACLELLFFLCLIPIIAPTQDHNVHLSWKFQLVSNKHSTLLWYCGTQMIAAVKGFIVQAQVLHFFW